MSKFKEVHIQCLENARDGLMVNIGIICQSLDKALPFTTDKAELCKMYLSLDEHLKVINKNIDDAVANSEENEDLINA